MAEKGSKKSGTAWVQELNKEEVIKELKERGTEATKVKTLDELRQQLRAAVRKKGESEKQPGGKRQTTREPSTQNGVYKSTGLQNRRGRLRGIRRAD